jgi:hypothetical protein
MTYYAIAPNNSSTFYEVHRPGCAHLERTDKYPFSVLYQGGNAADAAATYEAQNEGCLTKIAPCAKAVRA